MIKLNADVKSLGEKRNELIKQLGGISQFINGTIVKKEMTCGNKEKCKCGRGEKHVGYYLIYAEDNHPKTAYIPKDLHKDVQDWCKEYKRVKKLIKDICELQRTIMRSYVKGKRQMETSKKGGVL